MKPIWPITVFWIVRHKREARIGTLFSVVDNCRLSFLYLPLLRLDPKLSLYPKARHTSNEPNYILKLNMNKGWLITQSENKAALID